LNRCAFLSRAYVSFYSKIALHFPHLALNLLLTRGFVHVGG